MVISKLKAEIKQVKKLVKHYKSECEGDPRDKYNKKELKFNERYLGRLKELLK